MHYHEGVINSAIDGIRLDPADAPLVDHAVRAVAHALLVGYAKVSAPPSEEIPPYIAACLRYTRDRICVPRDMSYTAARQLRAHLNWVADCIDPRGDGKWRGVPLPMQRRADMDPAIFHTARI